MYINPESDMQMMVLADDLLIFQNLHGGTWLELMLRGEFEKTSAFFVARHQKDVKNLKRTTCGTDARITLENDSKHLRFLLMQGGI